jgi:PhoPQ-activated pathogenicity-related protein
MLMLLWPWGPVSAELPLERYLRETQRSLRFEVTGEQRIGEARAVTVRVTSQAWRGTPWRHWMTILVPPNVRHRDAAVLLIGGGGNSNRPPRIDSPAVMMMLQATQHVGVPIIVLQQVPNQPLFGGLYEDALIAHTFDQFLRTGREDWPALLPMTRAVVAAMDAATAVGRQRLDLNLSRFILTGVSKRGWTAWLAAASDRRVIGVAPAVIDLLNIEAQLELQLGAYGELSESLRDYTHRRIPERFATDRGQALLRIVDPFAYRERLTMPKLILLGTNDPFWTLDAANLYFPDLPEPRHLHYEPNGGHGLGPGGLATLAAFIEHTLGGEAMPSLQWTYADGVLRLRWEGPGQAVLWHAEAPDRDFRHARWVSRPLEGAGEATAELPPPDTGFRAYYAQVEFPGALPYRLSTQVLVLPTSLPHAGRMDPPVQRR